MNRLNISQRLQIMAGVAVAALVVLAASSLYVANSLHGSMQYIYTNTLPSIRAIDAVNEDFLRLRLSVLYHFVQHDAQKKSASEAQIGKLKEKIRDGLARYSKELAADARDQAILDKEDKAFEAYFASIEQPLERSRANDYDGLWVNIERSTAVMNELSAAVAEHREYNAQLAAAHYARADGEASIGKIVSLGLAAIALVVVGGISFFVIREIRGRMSRLSAFINEVNRTLDCGDERALGRRRRTPRVQRTARRRALRACRRRSGHRQDRLAEPRRYRPRRRRRDQLLRRTRDPQPHVAPERVHQRGQPHPRFHAAHRDHAPR